MFRKTVALLGVVAVAGSTAAVAGAKTTHPKKHKVNITATLTKQASQGQGGPLVYKGTVRGTGGKGTTTVKETIVSATKSTATSVTVYKKGKLNAKFTLTQNITSTGTTFTGTGKATGGTGIYKHAKGNLKATGSATSDLSSAKLKITGTIKY